MSNKSLDQDTRKAKLACATKHFNLRLNRQVLLRFAVVNSESSPIKPRKASTSTSLFYRITVQPCDVEVLVQVG